MRSIFGNLQRVGKALMTPVAVLPVAALFLRFGQPDVLDIPIISAVGSAIFGNLPLLFAIGVAFGLAKGNKGLAGLGGAVGYLLMTNIAVIIDDKINMGVLAGMVTGILAGIFYNLLVDQLEGQKLNVLYPMLILGVGITLGGVFGYIWPPIQMQIDSLGNWIIAAGPVGAGVFGFLNRLLIPVGLHHVLNSFLWFVFGSFNGITGDLHRFFAGDPTAGTFMAGFFPIMMFGLPAVALAIYTTAKKENRSSIAGLLFSLGFTSFLTGITEPLEFTFMFLAPGLYLVHALLTGLSLGITSALGILHGFGFSAGAIDYILGFGIATKPLLLIPVGLATFGLYYGVFVLVIKVFNLQTPGRAENESGDENAFSDKSLPQIALEFLNALGGHENVLEVDACITRLRLTVASSKHIDEDTLKTLGASGIIKPTDKNIQVIVGTKAEIIAEEIKVLLT